MLNNKGFTLIEAIVVTAVFIIIIMITSSAFNTIITQTNKLMRVEESNIEGVVGLEMLRHDLEQIGFGLPWAFMDAPAPAASYAEATAAPGSAYNDAPNGIPRAVLAGDNIASADPTTILNQTDYLVIKGTTVGRSRAAQRWTYLNYTSVEAKVPKTWPSENLVVGSDRVIFVRRFTKTGGYLNQLIYDTSDPSTFYDTYKTTANGFNSAFYPVADEYPVTMHVYGIDSSNLRMPFNRTDYFIKRPASNVPSSCAPNAGILYKTTVNHADGGLTFIPILDCVADMQVVFGWDLVTNATGTGDPDGQIDAYSNADGTVVNGGTVAAVQATMANAQFIRERLKLVKVYVLAQEGKKENTSLSTKSTLVVGDKDSGEISLTKNYDLAAAIGSEWSKYRWKVYRIVVRPKNLAPQN